MPATDSGLGPSMGSGGMPTTMGGRAMNDSDGPTILGLLAFGLTSILFGLSQLPGPFGSGFVTKTIFGFNTVWLPATVVTGTMTTLGGIVLILLGLIMLFKAWNPYWGVAFFGFGAFWVAWSGISSTLADHTVNGYGTAGFAFVWLLFSLTFLITSLKHGWTTFVFYLVLTLGFIMLVIEFWQYAAWSSKLPLSASIISGDELGVIAGLWILAGIIAWYAGTARLTELTYGRKVLPS